MSSPILILGGTTEARELAALLAARGIEAVLSLAGRTANPVAMPVPVRLGGFGGAEGLVAHLREAGIRALVDATHPYAATMSRHAAEAAAMLGLPFLALRRGAWIRLPGDDWTEVTDARRAVTALGPSPRRVFLALGRQELAPFVAAPQHDYLIRSVDPVEPPLAVPRARYILARGPFGETAERAMLEEHRIEAIVCKNSGGGATYGKIAAARALGLRVVMLRRPELPEAPHVATAEGALAWLDHAGALRGV
ncbi:cobalt-precorrin-6A reductase [Roseococcus sp. SYP-B2431]|uniref:cobalt-precorrin-6A reductase n=1 Tax=Roseococcus sp. SYP-B2431 TaxID=2496640 RepID=UPI00103D4B05|nr:cobalt-precorrin-6A reductase [Roseococcus sp. SYP-B2431]TCH98177.1 cobalt-precorrin-6A reductase [Roseococcus sp. SYP-B2431]